MRFSGALVFSFAVWTACSCNSPTAPMSSDDRVTTNRTRGVRTRPVAPIVAPSALTGDWGGEHITLHFDGSRAQLEFDCASALFSSPVMLANGVFTADGEFIAGHGGPIHEGEQPPHRSVRFSGTVNGGNLSLDIVALDNGEALGHFDLVKGNAGRLFRCY